ncbi:MAG: PH domain-containing protein [Nanoarchaeota archaeon]
MREVGKVLENKERVIYEGKPKYDAYLLHMIISSTIAGIIIGVGAGFLIKTTLWGIVIGILTLITGQIIGHLYYSRLYYAITDKRIVIQSGIIGRDFKSIDYDQIKNVSVNVGIIGSIMKVGTIKIFTGEILGNKKSIQPHYDRIDYIETPYQIMKKLQTNLSKRKER